MQLVDEGSRPRDFPSRRCINQTKPRDQFWEQIAIHFQNQSICSRSQVFTAVESRCANELESRLRDFPLSCFCMIFNSISVLLNSVQISTYSEYIANIPSINITSSTLQAIYKSTACPLHQKKQNKQQRFQQYKQLNPNVPCTEKIDRIDSRHL